MVTYFCPKCWTVIEKNTNVCPSCGFEMDDVHQMDYETKLLSALFHTIPERRIMAAQILGNRQCIRALPIFKDILTGEERDYFFLRAVLLATAKIQHPDRFTILKQAMQHPSKLISDLASELIDQLLKDQTLDQWDNNTG